MTIAIMQRGLGNFSLADLLQSDFDEIFDILADGVFASYLLGFDSAQAEPRSKVSFADGDKPDPVVAQIGDDDFNIQLRFDVPPQEAIDYFERKKILKPKQFNKLQGAAKAGAFSVGGVYKTDVLNAFHGEIMSALETGKTQREVVQRFKDILNGAGQKMLGNFHLETVFRSNMMAAYGVGRRNAQEEVTEYLPFWQYAAIMDDRTRPSHAALDGLIYPANHSFWQLHYPPWDFNCRCYVNALPAMPADYDHERPNENADIAFDKDGLPAKAMYGMQMVDFKATSFQGIPPAADLEKVLNENAKRASKK